MSRKLQLRLEYDIDLEAYIRSEHPDLGRYRVLSRSLDARAANRGRKPHFNYTLEYEYEAYQEQFPVLGPLKQPPIIIGAGPAGLFCALRLMEYGVPSIIVERGDCAQARMKKIARFWRYGDFDDNSNVCFGEGGAGLFSDGKLITRIKSPYVKYVMNRLVDFGAPEETAYRNDPHLGSNIIRGLIGKITDYLKEKGCQILYNSKMESLISSEGVVKGVELTSGKKIYSDHVVLATGHSARDLYRYLENERISLVAKDFAVGVRVEHPRLMINKLQYGRFEADPLLETAKYRLSYHDKKSERGCFSFCMCPGGYVLSAGTEADGLVTNGMSNFARNSSWSNSALVVSVKAGTDFQGPLGGIDYQRGIESIAYKYSKEKASGKELPAQRLVDFLEGRSPKDLPKTSTPSHAFLQSLDKILPDNIYQHLIQGVEKFNGNINGFIDEQAVVYAPETRTSAPVRIIRDSSNLQSPDVKGVYPCGEGAGYAGGITSAAVDGIKVAMSILTIEKDYQQ